MRFKNLIKTFLSYSLIIILFCCNCKSGYHQERWSEEEANQWYDEVEWKSGANFVPSTVINLDIVTFKSFGSEFHSFLTLGGQNVIPKGVKFTHILGLFVFHSVCCDHCIGTHLE